MRSSEVRAESTARAYDALQAALEFAADGDAMTIAHTPKPTRPITWDRQGALRFPDYTTGT